LPPSRVERIIDDWQARGRYTFSREDLTNEMGKWDTTVRDALRRLTRRSRIARPRTGFYVIVPLEYRSAGAPPPSWFIDPLMDYADQPYYVGLLSAAALHGAAHHRPQEFQVVTDQPTRSAMVGRGRIRFFVSSVIDQMAVKRVKTTTGTMRVSTPAATALDLVRYVRASGGYDNVATVLVELAERIDSDELALLAEHVPSVVARRTGYLLERVGAPGAAAALGECLSGTALAPQPLEPAKPKGGAGRDDRWALYINTSVEPDIS